MSKFSAIVCDHCDARDVLDSPVVPHHKIKNFKIQMDEMDIIECDLCEKCFKDLKDTIYRLTTQQPKEASRIVNGD